MLRRKKTPEARNVREGLKRQKSHRAPQGEAFLAGGLEVPREESFQGVTGIQKGAKGEIEIPLPPFALAGEAARPQATRFDETLL